MGIFGVVRPAPTNHNSLLPAGSFVNENRDVSESLPGDGGLRLGAALFAPEKGILQEHEIQIHGHTDAGKTHMARNLHTAVLRCLTKHRVAAKSSTFSWFLVINPPRNPLLVL